VAHKAFLARPPNYLDELASSISSLEEQLARVLKTGVA
jgi:hypothetical protein